MSYTQADLTAIDAAIVALLSGERVTEIRFADRWVKYHDVSVNDLRALRDEIARKLGTQYAPLHGRTWYAVQGTKGL
ncbi:gpW family head-tail joining protein [Castellaniella sp. S9]|uniref:gpW family head-tail joining protein n=1 Tax=Castellaniella sp. S9 TaxID=2993652 RepID=UPI0022B4C8E4|nr:gpW family head-tail joining protein [Castellaniella sp. S9]